MAEKSSVKENTTPLKTPATLSRRRSAEKGPAAVYEGSGSQRRRESRFRGTNQLIVPESVNADADPYRFLPKPAPRAAKAAVTAPRADDAAAEEPRGRLSFGAAAPPAAVSTPGNAAVAPPAPVRAGRRAGARARRAPVHGGLLGPRRGRRGAMLLGPRPRRRRGAPAAATTAARHDL